MKLVEILARELKEWPSCTDVVGQAIDGTIHLCDSFDANMNGHSDQVFNIAEDSAYTDVTRSQWEAERARILLESQPERDADVAKVVDGVAARSAEDQALWDKVAIAAIGGVFASRGFHEFPSFQGVPENAAIFGADVADAFMVERAKRMKG